MPQEIPELRDWLALPLEVMAERVAEHKVTVYVSTDGTQRHYFLTHPEMNGQLSDYKAYAQATGFAYTKLFNLLFSAGIHTVLTANMYPPNFQRGAQLLDQMIAMSRLILVNPPFTDLYKQWQVQARLYGDYDLAPAAAKARSSLITLDQELAALTTPYRQRLLLFGYCAGSFSDEMIVRTLALSQQLKRAPTTDELRQSCFPFGPDRLNLFINTGWFRVGGTLPPVLDQGTDLYNLSILAFDLTEHDLRRILYDHLFLRNAAPEDNIPYTPDDLQELADYYAHNSQYVIGLGRLVGSGLWYPDNNAHLFDR